MPIRLNATFPRTKPVDPRVNGLILPPAVPRWCGVRLSLFCSAKVPQLKSSNKRVVRAITATTPGRSHPLLATRPSVFDALCSHIDELEQLPSGAEVLAQNELCPIQALALELPSGSIFFGTQYHPEFTLSVAAGLIEMRATSLVAEGFSRDRAELVAMARDFRALHAEPERRDLAWRYGIGPEILDPVRRTTEIGNWLREAAEISSS